MIWLLLLIPSLYFSARFFLLIRDINKVKRELEEIGENIELNRRLRYFSGNKSFENLLVGVNSYLEKAQKEKIKYINREKVIKVEVENISHDLRTPLTSILGYLELLENEDIDSETKKEYLAIIQRRAKGLHNLVDIFYDVSKFESNDFKVNMEMINIDKEVREQVLLFYTDFEKNNIEVEVELLEKEIYIMADKNALERVFTNLFQNAIKYTKGYFKVSLKIEDEVVNIVLENYTDLDNREVEHLFDRFYMKDNSRGTDSSGLGLTVTKLLVEKMDGNIKVELIDNMLRVTMTYEIYSEIS